MSFVHHFLGYRPLSIGCRWSTSCVRSACVVALALTVVSVVDKPLLYLIFLLEFCSLGRSFLFMAGLERRNGAMLV